MRSAQRKCEAKPTPHQTTGGTQHHSKGMTAVPRTGGGGGQVRPMCWRQLWVVSAECSDQHSPLDPSGPSGQAFFLFQDTATALLLLLSCMLFRRPSHMWGKTDLAGSYFPTHAKTKEEVERRMSNSTTRRRKEVSTTQIQSKRAKATPPTAGRENTTPPQLVEEVVSGMFCARCELEPNM